MAGLSMASAESTCSPEAILPVRALHLSLVLLDGHFRESPQHYPGGFAVLPPIAVIRLHAVGGDG